MTRDELEKEVEEWIKDHSGLIGGYKFVKYDYDSMQKAYLAGAEPKEKQIRALQKQNGELTDELEKLKKQLEELPDKWCRNKDDYCPHLAKLEKENAELKSGCGMCYRKDKEQLTKAKELLERLLITSCNSDVLNLLPNCSEVLRVRVEAEQFLNSEVEK